jgi:hypothetical protein
MATGGTFDQQRAEVARVATLIFGAKVEPDGSDPSIQFFYLLAGFFVVSREPTKRFCIPCIVIGREDASALPVSRL